MSTLLEVKNLCTYLRRNGEPFEPLTGWTLPERGGYPRVVGESGCGKTVLALSIMRLVPPPGRIVSGNVLFEGTDLIRLGEEEMRKVRGKQISMIFQEPMTSLNPVFRVGEQIAEAVELHLGLSKKKLSIMPVAMLRLVGMPSPEERILDYPHQMSGGMRQRVMIAMALSCNPRLMLADEPTNGT